jgi:GntR family transcriptional repressor for pyruvate dehydrogenase complex
MTSMSEPYLALHPIDARKRADQVRDRLVELIREQRLQEGDKLPTEPQLMEMFGVGRSSVRAAVQSLVGLGIVELRPGRGAYIRRLSVDDLVNMVQGAVQLDYSAAMHLHEVRAMIETSAARLAARRRTQEHLDAMRHQIELYAIGHASKETEAAIDADLGFHRTIVVAAQNPVLLSLLDSITGLLRVHRRQYGAFTEASERARVITEHDGIVAAIERGDSKLSARLAARHMRLIWHQIEEVVPHDKEDDTEETSSFFDELMEDS